MVTVNNKKVKFLKKFLFMYIIVAMVCISAKIEVRTAFAGEPISANTYTTVLELSKYPPIIDKELDSENISTKVIKYFLEDGSFMLTTQEIADEINKRKEQKLQEEKEREENTVVPVNKTEEADIYITQYTDLSVNKTITTDDMNRIIEYWNEKCGGTPFLGRGDVFIKASKESGLDPIYIFSHAAYESGWGKSDLAVYKSNYFGISAFDSNPYECGYVMGDDLYTGIVQGAIWINDNYYQQGQVSLYDMIYGPKQYASTADCWIGSIQDIMNTSYYIIQSQDI